jgi:hypothetical protein
MQWADERMIFSCRIKKNMGMLAVNMEVQHMNVRNKTGIVNTLKLRQTKKEKW